MLFRSLDIYPAGEKPIDGISTPTLIERIHSFGHKHAFYAPDYETVIAYLSANASAGDAVVVMGAGSVTKLADILSERLSRTA